MYPLLPCRDIDEAVTFYEALGFTRTYRQVRPNPHAVVERGELAVHLFGMDGFDPADSYGSVIITVPDPDALYAAFAAGLRAAYGRLPVAGIPRMVRPRKRWGTVYGFSVVDVGGNWLRISKTGDREAERDATEPGLSRAIEVAARLADAKGDDEQALKTLVAGLDRSSRRAGPGARPGAAVPRGAGDPARPHARTHAPRWTAADAIDLDQQERSETRRRHRPRHRAARRRRLIGPQVRIAHAQRGHRQAADRLSRCRFAIRLRRPANWSRADYDHRVTARNARPPVPSGTSQQSRRRRGGGAGTRRRGSSSRRQVERNGRGSGSNRRPAGVTAAASGGRAGRRRSCYRVRLRRRSRKSGSGTGVHAALLLGRAVLPQARQLHPDRRLGPQRRVVQGLRLRALLEVRAAAQAVGRAVERGAGVGQEAQHRRRLPPRRRRGTPPRGRLHERDVGREHRLHGRSP